MGLAGRAACVRGAAAGGGVCRECCVKFAHRRTAASLWDILRCMHNDSLCRQKCKSTGGRPCGKQLEQDTAEQMGVGWGGRRKRFLKVDSHDRVQAHTQAA